jgi:hypothetical protein
MTGQRGYKRSWKNLLINKRYQLRFTLFMVGLSTVLMTGLGIWIMVVANETTKVSMTSERGHRCPRIPAIQAPYEDIPAPPPTPMKLPEPAKAEPPKPEPAPKPDAPVADEPKDDAGEPRRRPKIEVKLDEMEVPKPVIVTPPVPENFGKRVVDHWTCELQIASRIVKLEQGRQRILLVLIAAGILLVLGLAAYGLKMTHRVAGPLFKVQLYLAKMRDGRFDKVYNLRKGDQLVDFYDHFKQAHAGVVKLEKSDIERLKKVIAAAEGAGAGDHPSIVELRTLLARKEKSLE